MSKTISEFTRHHKSCGKNIILIHEDKKLMPNSNSPTNSNNIKTIQTAPQQNSINTDENLEIPLILNKIENTSSENMSFYNFYQSKY